MGRVGWKTGLRLPPPPRRGAATCLSLSFQQTNHPRIRSIFWFPKSCDPVNPLILSILWSWEFCDPLIRRSFESSDPVNPLILWILWSCDPKNSLNWSFCDYSVGENQAKIKNHVGIQKENIGNRRVFYGLMENNRFAVGVIGYDCNSFLLSCDAVDYLTLRTYRPHDPVIPVNHWI